MNVSQQGKEDVFPGKGIGIFFLQEREIGILFTGGHRQWMGEDKLMIGFIDVLGDYGEIDDEYKELNNMKRIEGTTLKARSYDTDEYQYIRYGVRPLIIVNASDIRD